PVHARKSRRNTVMGLARRPACARAPRPGAPLRRPGRPAGDVRSEARGGAQPSRILAGMRPPSVDALARELADVGLPHPLLVDAAREAIAAGAPGSARERAEAVAAALLRQVINATGVLLHTNLGRAPLAWSQPAAYA